MHTDEKCQSDELYPKLLRIFYEASATSDTVKRLSADKPIYDTQV